MSDNKNNSSMFENNGEIKSLFNLAKQGDTEAQYKLGRSYYLGDGIKQDYRKAVKWYRRSAKQGYADAMDVLKEVFDKK